MENFTNIQTNSQSLNLLQQGISGQTSTDFGMDLLSKKSGRNQTGQQTQQQKEAFIRIHRNGDLRDEFL